MPEARLTRPRPVEHGRERARRRPNSEHGRIIRGNGQITKFEKYAFGFWGIFCAGGHSRPHPPPRDSGDSETRVSEFRVGRNRGHHNPKTLSPVTAARAVPVPGSTTDEAGYPDE